MEKIRKRSLLFNINKFQVSILFPILLSTFIILLLLSSFYYLTLNKTSVVYETKNSTTIVYKYALDNIENIIPFLIAISSIILFFLILWTYKVSNNLVGPFERIVKELDDIIEGKKEAITPLRKGDDMFEELLKRINILIEKSRK